MQTAASHSVGFIQLFQWRLGPSCPETGHHGEAGGEGILSGQNSCLRKRGAISWRQEGTHCLFSSQGQENFLSVKVPLGAGMQGAEA